ncbi:unnamed protein product, partial [Heterosigma akashiwo]
MIFETKRPVWNEQIQAWTLNFNGRVKIPSKKNFFIQAELDNHIMESEFGEDVYLFWKNDKIKVFARFSPSTISSCSFSYCSKFVCGQNACNMTIPTLQRSPSMKSFTAMQYYSQDLSILLNMMMM